MTGAERTCRRLLRLYPADWRARYGEELTALVVETSCGGVPWRVRADVSLAAARERLRSAGLSGDAPPGERVRGGALLALCAWALFVVAGAGVQKLSEHWQAATPAGSRGVPSAAFTALVAGAAVGTALVLAGIAAATPSLVRLVRGGGWPLVRRKVVVAAALTALAAAATVGIVVWARHLDAARRDGRDAAYAGAVAAWALLLVCSLAAWTAAAVATARRLELSPRTLRLEALLAAGVAAAMAAMTAATAVWWAALATSAPWFLAGRPPGEPGSPLAPSLLAAGVVMLAATALGAAGAARALRAAPRP